MSIKKDLKLAALAGFLIAALAIPIIANVGLPPVLKSWGSVGVSVLLFLLIIVGFLILDFASRRFGILRQITKFIIVGGLNTFLDFAVLNFLISLSGIAVGLGFSLFKGISFLVAVTNSYFWNKYWTFEFTAKKQLEFIQFVVVSTIGFFINVGVASFVVNNIGAPSSASPELWANFGALVAVAASLIWNFLGYKFIVFRR